MKRLSIPGVADVIRVDEPDQIRALAADSRIDRQFDLRTRLWNWFLLKRSLGVLPAERKAEVADDRPQIHPPPRAGVFSRKSGPVTTAKLA